MSSSYCYSCYTHNIKDYELLIFVKCNRCTEHFMFFNDVRNAVTSIIIENLHKINFKNFKSLKVNKYEELDSYVNNLAKHRSRTILSTVAHDLFTIGGTNSRIT